MFMRATKRAGEVPKIKTFRESEACFHFLVETIATPIFISRGERLHYVNHAAEVLTGYTRKELLSMNFWDLIPPDSREPVELASPCEVRILTKNHKERWLDITATPVDLSHYRYSRAIRGRRVCRRAARDRCRGRRACRVSHSQSARNG